MENKLTIEMIAPYLPYGLKILYTGKEGDKELHVMGIHDDGGKVCGADEPDVYPNFSLAVCWRPEHRSRSNGYFYIQANYKPILRPMSDLTKDFKNEGTPFYNYIGQHTQIGGDGLLYLLVDGTHWDCNPLNWDFGTVQLLFKHHFDVFGLIPAGLAIEKGA